MAIFNEVGRRSGSEALRKASSLNCAICAAEGGVQVGLGWPGGRPLDDGQGGAKLSGGAFITKNVLSENKRKISMAMTIIILTSTFDMILRRILYSSIPIRRSKTDT